MNPVYDRALAHFSERLRVALAVSQISQHALARDLQITPAAVSKWTNGICAPRSSHLMEICRLTGCSLEWLMTVAPVDITKGSG